MKAGNYKAASGDKVLIDHGFMLIRWIGVKLHGSRGKKKNSSKIITKVLLYFKYWVYMKKEPFRIII